MDNFDERDDYLVGIICSIKIREDPPLYGLRPADGIPDRLYRTVPLVCHFIVLRHIYPLYLGEFHERVFPRQFLSLALSETFDRFNGDLLSVSQSKEIEEIRYGLGIARTRSAGKYNGVIFPPLACEQRYPCEIQHIEYRGI